MEIWRISVTWPIGTLVSFYKVSISQVLRNA